MSETVLYARERAPDFSGFYVAVPISQELVIRDPFQTLLYVWWAAQRHAERDLQGPAALELMRVAECDGGYVLHFEMSAA